MSMHLLHHVPRIRPGLRRRTNAFALKAKLSITKRILATIQLLPRPVLRHRSGIRQRTTAPVARGKFTTTRRTLAMTLLRNHPVLQTRPGSKRLKNAPVQRTKLGLERQANAHQLRLLTLPSRIAQTASGAIHGAQSGVAYSSTGTSRIAEAAISRASTDVRTRLALVLNSRHPMSRASASMSPTANHRNRQIPARMKHTLIGAMVPVSIFSGTTTIAESAAASVTENAMTGNATRRMMNPLQLLQRLRRRRVRRLQ